MKLNVLTCTIYTFSWHNPIAFNLSCFMLMNYANENVKTGFND